jgi:hypothetical protein
MGTQALQRRIPQQRAKTLENISIRDLVLDDKVPTLIFARQKDHKRREMARFTNGIQVRLKNRQF